MTNNTIQIQLPDDITLGDIASAKGAIIEASGNYVDWAKLYNKEGDAISAPGRILLAIAHQLYNYKGK